MAFLLALAGYPSLIFAETDQLDDLLSGDEAIRFAPEWAQIVSRARHSKSTQVALQSTWVDFAGDVSSCEHMRRRLLEYHDLIEEMLILTKSISLRSAETRDFYDLQRILYRAMMTIENYSRPVGTVVLNIDLAKTDLAELRWIIIIAPGNVEVSPIQETHGHGIGYAISQNLMQIREPIPASALCDAAPKIEIILVPDCMNPLSQHGARCLATDIVSFHASIHFPQRRAPKVWPR